MVEHNLVHQYGHWQLCHFVSTTKNGLTLWSEFTPGQMRSRESQRPLCTRPVWPSASSRAPVHPTGCHALALTARCPARAHLARLSPWTQCRRAASASHGGAFCDAPTPQHTQYTSLQSVIRRQPWPLQFLDARAQQKFAPEMREGKKSKRARAERASERESLAWMLGMEFYSKNPTPIGSRPRGLIGLFLSKRETEHLWLRQLMHGIGRDPFARA